MVTRGKAGEDEVATQIFKRPVIVTLVIHFQPI